jgi:hypothetical protein
MTMLARCPPALIRKCRALLASELLVGRTISAGAQPADEVNICVSAGAAKSL